MHKHNHDHHTHDVADFGKAFRIGIGLNVCFVVIEFVCGLWFNSTSLLADAGHNLSDVFGLALAWLGFRLSRVQPSSRFTYGLGSTTIIASTINGAILLVAVGAISWEAISRFGSPVDVNGTGIIWVALVGVVVNTLTALLFARGRHGDLNIKGAYLHMAADAIVSLGVVVAGALILLTGWNWIDPLVSLLVAGVILYSTWSLFRDSLALLSHGVPRHVELAHVKSYFEELPEVESIHDLHIWALSTTKTALTTHLVVTPGVQTDALLRRIAEDLHEKFAVAHSTIQLENRALDDACNGQLDGSPLCNVHD